MPADVLAIAAWSWHSHPASTARAVLDFEFKLGAVEKMALCRLSALLTEALERAHALAARAEHSAVAADGLRCPHLPVREFVHRGRGQRFAGSEPWHPTEKRTFGFAPIAAFQLDPAASRKQTLWQGELGVWIAPLTELQLDDGHRQQALTAIAVQHLQQAPDLPNGRRPRVVGERYSVRRGRAPCPTGR